MVEPFFIAYNLEGDELVFLVVHGLDHLAKGPTPQRPENLVPATPCVCVYLFLFM